jgi:hypothetical protein
LGLSLQETSGWQIVVCSLLAAIHTRMVKSDESDGHGSDHAPSLQSLLKSDTNGHVARLSVAREMLASIGPFYASLTPAQRSRADRLIPPLLRAAGVMGPSFWAYSAAAGEQRPLRAA